MLHEAPVTQSSHKAKPESKPQTKPLSKPAAAPNVIVAPPASTTTHFVTQEVLEASLRSFADLLRLDFSSIANASNPTIASGGVWNSIAGSNKIDQLNSVAITGSTITNTALSGVTGLTMSDISDLDVSAVSALAYATTSNLASLNGIAAWGDSLVNGVTGLTNFPTALTSLTGYFTYNGGVGGETSTQIATRMLADTSKYDMPTIIWSGHNNTSNQAQILSDIASMVSALSTSNYVVLSILNTSIQPSGSGGYTTVASINSALASAYGSRFLDLRAYLVSQYDSNVAQDVTDYGNDVVPTSLRYDTLHLNAAGNAKVAQFINTNISKLIPTASTSSVITAEVLASLFSSPPVIGGTAPNSGFFSQLDTTLGYTQGGVKVLNTSASAFSAFVGPYAAQFLSSVSTSTYNTALGDLALTLARQGSYNTAVGAATMSATSTVGSYNVAVGVYALNNTVGNDNTAVGVSALTTNTTGARNIGIGREAGRGNTTGNDNTAMGYFSMYTNTTGIRNTAVGGSAGVLGTTGNDNTSFGYGALRSNTTGSNNTSIGKDALYNNAVSASNVALGMQAGYGTSGQTSSSNNVFIGFQSGFANTTGNNNTIVGYQAGRALTTGSSNIILGYFVDATSTTATRQLNIGNALFGTNMYNTAAVSGVPVTGATIGVGTSSPYARLTVAGDANGTMPLFLISSSTSAFATSTAFVVTSAGKVGIGTTSPSTQLQVAGDIAPNADNLYTDGNATYRWAAVYAVNGTIQTSDIRLKENIATTTYGLDELLRLRPATYTWRHNPEQGRKLGFIAQEVQSVLPEAVDVGNDADHTLGLKYSEFTPLIVRSVQQVFERLSELKAVVESFAQKITTDLLSAKKIETKELCISKADGSSVCLTGEQLASVIATASPGLRSASAIDNKEEAGELKKDSEKDTDDKKEPANEAPKIFINGANPAKVLRGATYSDLGARAEDDHDMNLGVHVYVAGEDVEHVSFDTSTTTTYTVTYRATDTAGKVGEATRTVLIYAETE